MNHDLPADNDLPESPARTIGRFFFVVVTGAALASAGIVSTVDGPMSPLWRQLCLISIGLLAAASALVAHRSVRPQFRMNVGLYLVATLAILTIGFVSFAMTDGLRDPLVTFVALIVCVIGAITSIRHGAMLGGFAMAGMALLAELERRGLVSAPPGSVPLLILLLVHWLIVVCAAIAGYLIARTFEQYLRATAEREQRFRGLLRIAVDWYWEQDSGLRFTHISEIDGDGKGPPRKQRLNRPSWQLADMGLSTAQLDAHRADLEAHRPFSGLIARRTNAAGQPRTVSISGEPRFDASGAFCGYWGVGRDITREVRAQRAVAASETRYRELFTRSPSPLFLHRRGVVFDANEATARLFGFENAAAMNGLEVADLFPAGAARTLLLERLGRLEAMPLGEGLPIADFQLRALDGRPLYVQATEVRVSTVNGPANLSIVFDVTARTATERALRRSEAMLSHLFATSPDCIALTETASGRYAMVNAAFCRVTGFEAGEVVGRTHAELGLWKHPSQYTDLVARVAREGSAVDLPAVFMAKSGAQVAMLLSVGRFAMDHRNYFVINARDVTASEATRLQHAAILERASIGIAFTRAGRFVQTNPFFERMFGWEPNTLPGHLDSVIWPHADDHREVANTASPLLSAGQPFETERGVRRHDGSRFWCRLLAQVVDRNDPIGSGTIWIAEDVTERRRLDAALASARDAAEAASDAKSAFLANTSHEIRTPLNGLLGLTRLAMQEHLPAERRQHYLTQILGSAEGLAGIMSDILDVSKIEAGKFALEDVAFDLREMLAAVHHAYDPLAGTKGLAFELVIDAHVPTVVRGDSVRVRQILSNFITNALKFTERGRVRLDVGSTPQGRVRLAVTDTGPGVTAEAQTRLFMPFSQGDTSITRRFGGTGLGLSICRELARLMGGTVGLDSTLDVGSTFWAELPLPAASVAEGALNTEAADRARLQGTQVLMAEDNAVNMMIAVAMLEHWGVQVVQVADGRAAVEAVHAAAREGRQFDVVLMDVQMPVMGGHEAASELRRHYPAGTLPILALTAAALVSERERALAAGMDDFLTKPIDAIKLRQTLARVVASRGRIPQTEVSV